MPSPPHSSSFTPAAAPDGHSGPIICDWGFCRQIFDSTRNMKMHVNLDHIYQTRSERARDIQQLLRAEEGIGDSFSTGNSFANVSQLSEVEKRVNDSQDSAGVASLPSPPVTNHALTPVSSPPSHPHLHSEDDHLERSYRSPSPFAEPLPDPDSVSPFLFNEDEVPDALSTVLSPVQDDHMIQWTSGIRLPSPTFAELSSSIPGSPVPVFDPPSPSLSALVRDCTENKTKRKSPDDGFDEEDQSSISSSESRRQVENQLTQTIQYEGDEQEVEGVTPSYSDLSNDHGSSPSMHMNHLFPVPPDSSSEHHPTSPHISSDTPPQPLYSQPHTATPYSMPRVQVSPVQQQAWYMPRKMWSQRKGSSSALTSAAQSPVDPGRTDHFALCQSQALTQVNDPDALLLMSQAPYDSQAYAD